MTVPLPGTPVQVLLSDGITKLGSGTILGKTTAYYFQMPDGSLHLWSDRPSSISEIEPQPAPPQEWVNYLKSIGVKLVTVPETPTILLDDGRVVYGCSVIFIPKQKGDRV